MYFWCYLNLSPPESCNRALLSVRSVWDSKAKQNYLTEWPLDSYPGFELFPDSHIKHKSCFAYCSHT